MNVKQLREALSAYDDNLEVIVVQHSDYCPIEAGCVHVISGVPKDDWVMRSHDTMSEKNKRAERQYLLIGTSAYA